VSEERVRLPTLQITGCDVCPFADLGEDECKFPFADPKVTVTVYDLDLYDHALSSEVPDNCPGRKYDIAVEFPNEQ